MTTSISTLLFAVLLTSSCLAQTRAAGVENPAELTAQAPKLWVKLGGVGVIYHASAAVSAAGAAVPGASVAVGNQATVTFDLGYDFTKNLSASFMAGIPVKPALTAAGIIAADGKLGSVYYGPAVASSHYHLRSWGPFQAYAGGGAAYAIILKNYDALIAGLKVKNNFGPVAQGGVDCVVTKKLGVYVDFKQLWLGVNASGNLGGVAPATSHVTLNPSLIDAGIKYRF